MIGPDFVREANATVVRTLPQRLLAIEPRLFAALMGLQLLLVWSSTYIPTEDGPSHVYNAEMLRTLYLPSGALFREYFIINKWFVPNELVHAILAAAGTVVSPWAAERILVSIYALGLPLCARYAASGVRRESAALCWLVFPLVFGYAFHKGFWGFSLGLLGYFALVGYWARHEKRFGLRESAVMTALSLLTYASHFMPLVAALLTIGMLGTFATIGDWFGRQRARARELFVPRIAGPAYACLTAVLLGVLFVAPRVVLGGRAAAPGGVSEVSRPNAIPDLSWSELTRAFVQPEALVSFSERELVIASATFVCFSAAILLAGVHWLRRREPGVLRFGLPAAVFTGLYFVAPDWLIAGGHLKIRLELLAFLAAPFWVAGVGVGQRATAALVAGAGAIALAAIASHAIAYREIQPAIENYLGVGECIGQDSVLLPLDYDRTDPLAGRRISPRIDPLGHGPSRLALARHAVDLANYEAQTGYFPLLFRKSHDPAPFIGLSGDGIGRYVGAGEGRVDFVLVRGFDEAQMATPAGARLSEELASDFELHCRRDDPVRLDVYRRKPTRP